MPPLKVPRLEQAREDELQGHLRPVVIRAARLDVFRYVQTAQVRVVPAAQRSTQSVLAFFALLREFA